MVAVVVAADGFLPAHSPFPRIFMFVLTLALRDTLWRLLLDLALWRLWSSSPAHRLVVCDTHYKGLPKYQKSYVYVCNSQCSEKKKT